MITLQGKAIRSYILQYKEWWYMRIPLDVDVWIIETEDEIDDRLNLELRAISSEYLRKRQNAYEAHEMALDLLNLNKIEEKSQSEHGR